MEVLKMMVFCISYGCVTDHCLKSVQIGSYFWSVFSCIRNRKIRTRNYSISGHFSRNGCYLYYYDTFEILNMFFFTVLRDVSYSCHFKFFSP